MSITISNKKIMWDVLIFLTIFPCLKSTYFDTIDWLDHIINIWRVATFFLVLLIWAIMKISLSREQVRIIEWYLLYNASVVLAGVINQISLRDTLVRIMSQFTAVFFCVIYLKYAKDCFFDVIFFLAEFFVYVNLVLMWLYPGGMYKAYYARHAYLGMNWFLGNKNTFFTYYIIFFSVAMLFIISRKKTFRSLLLIIAMGISTILSSSSTLIISYVVLLVLSFLALSVDVSRLLNGRTLTITSVALFFIIVIFRYFDYITRLMGKSNTLTGRTILWDTLFILIKKQPIFGYGYSTQTLAKLTNTKWALHAHDTILQCLYEGGIVELAIYLVLIFLLAENLYKYRRTKEGIVLSVSFFAFNFASITEFYTRGHIFFLIGMIIGLENILGDYEQSKSIEMGKEKQMELSDGCQTI